jgi:hypothetical protein
MTTIKDISVKMDNKPGALWSLSELLRSNGLAILGLTVRQEGDRGIVNFLAGEPSRVLHVLESAGYTPTAHEVIAAEVPSHPGGFNVILKALKNAEVNIDYLYSCSGPRALSEGAILLIGTDKSSAAAESLTREWIRLWGEEIYGIM